MKQQKTFWNSMLAHHIIYFLQKEFKQIFLRYLNIEYKICLRQNIYLWTSRNFKPKRVCWTKRKHCRQKSWWMQSWRAVAPMRRFLDTFSQIQLKGRNYNLQKISDFSDSFWNRRLLGLKFLEVHNDSLLKNTASTHNHILSLVTKMNLFL